MARFSAAHTAVQESLAAIGVNISAAALYMKVKWAGNLAIKEAPPIKEVEISQEDSKIYSLASRNLSKGVDNTTEVVLKARRTRGVTNTHKREVELIYKKCLNSITTNYATLLTMTGVQKKNL